MRVSQQRRRELAEFLRSRRERLQPADVELPPGRRRRTPGLRREEVALLSGVSATWYTFLEQGREIRTSREVLEALARVLRLDEAEHAHLLELAHGRDRAQEAPPVEALSPRLAQVLDLMDGTPAYVTGRRWDILAYNRAAAAIFTEFASLPQGRQNILWWVFTVPAARDVLADWEGEAQALLARFRAAAGRHVGDPEFAELIEELHALSPQVRIWWPRHEVRDRGSGAKVFRHPAVGEFRLQPAVLKEELTPEQNLVIYSAEPWSADADALRRLVSSKLTGAIRLATAATILTRPHCPGAISP